MSKILLLAEDFDGMEVKGVRLLKAALYFDSADGLARDVFAVIIGFSAGAR